MAVKNTETSDNWLLARRVALSRGLGAETALTANAEAWSKKLIRKGRKSVNRGKSLHMIWDSSSNCLDLVEEVGSLSDTEIYLGFFVGDYDYDLVEGERFMRYHIALGLSPEDNPVEELPTSLIPVPGTARGVSLMIISIALAYHHINEEARKLNSMTIKMSMLKASSPELSSLEGLVKNSLKWRI